MFTKPPGRRASERSRKGPQRPSWRYPREIVAVNHRVLFIGSNKKPRKTGRPKRRQVCGVWLFFENSTGCLISQCQKFYTRAGLPIFLTGMGLLVWIPLATL